ncbi:uncharacterized protein LOC142981904 [Anticarsia gemmatalis]|uniref:uncharacterized protein LOC142981904 n=1 Tax=Anticarsia gemmatalis TaxID=129554 RepID=UPI003F76B687
MARVGVICACALLVIAGFIDVNAAPTREKRSPHLGLAGAAAGAVLAAPAAVLAAPAVALGAANYGPGYGGGYGGGYGSPVGFGGPGYGGPGYGGGLPGASFSSSKSFSIGGGNAQSSASSGAGGFGK